MTSKGGQISPCQSNLQYTVRVGQVRTIYFQNGFTAKKIRETK